MLNEPFSRGLCVLIILVQYLAIWLDRTLLYSSPRIDLSLVTDDDYASPDKIGRIANHQALLILHRRRRSFSRSQLESLGPLVSLTVLTVGSTLVPSVVQWLVVLPSVVLVAYVILWLALDKLQADDEVAQWEAWEAASVAARQAKSAA
ncbi:hypothetical protein SPRG_17937 [Saprolegnia parasitica CBS 223.65]|uniref:Uncharacterized protein n=1 Tax=Saprolegnia parasitica (strain CBS 223.65) TaxID=695850 RepID=A0A067BEJ7_SAPPC|nr:hypothetical protein SPRG_17937 [Saprolegnia parasitica CBS 223.65]KDO16553.1 hypothetical protein SPRG_17937 [Saprolegnia parasitica CBS 223.65]|eukprot:XP_012212741.1 hypothetical protein SPRG_17937 [Saprolegnia parasitica CBS 223.65]